jgi:DNA polymerase elongation subunit (family B)
VKGVGWLLDPYIDEKYVSMWIKTRDNKMVKLRERYSPSFLAEPKEPYTPENLIYLFQKHPFVYEAKQVQRFATIARKKSVKAVKVQVDIANDLDEVLRYAENLREVKEIYNSGLIPIQWYLIYRDLPPSSLCEFRETNGFIEEIKRIDDGYKLAPPPLQVLGFQVPTCGVINELNLLDSGLNHVKTIRGKESKILSEFNEKIKSINPDVLVTESPVQTSRNILRKAKRYGIDFTFGRMGEPYHGRIFLGFRSYIDSGIAGLVERARFTYAPMGVSADWEPGKTIDSRQCAEAVKLGVLVPKMKGGFGFKSTAWDMIRSDRGGMIFSPIAGLHENVALLDFESMFPNLVVSRNISYETVTEDGIDTSIPGFMGGFTKPFLERRLVFKHLKNQYARGSKEWVWCEQRQAALKLMLVVVYGYSGCYANRFANVRVFQEINTQARRSMVKALRIAQDEGYTVVYGPFDSLFVKREDASRDDYHMLASKISEATGLPIRLDRHFKYLVLLTKTTDPSVIVANRYYGKLMDDSLFYRGIELRRHDTPKYINSLQLRILNTMFDYDDADRVESEGVREALIVAEDALRRVRLGKVDPKELIISKRLRKELEDYQVLQPHIVAAMLGEETDTARYILMNTESSNPYLRVMPASMLDHKNKGYDKKKYAQMVRRSVWNLLRPFVRDEKVIGGKRLKAIQLDLFL